MSSLDLSENLQQFFRGTTIQFTATFRDFNGNVVQPSSAIMVIEYLPQGNPTYATVALTMTPPIGPSVAWTVQWDTRLVAPGKVWYSAHSSGNGPPFAAGDGCIELLANNANQPNFT